MNTRREANYKNLERASLWVVNADTKASLILAFNGGLFAHLVTKIPDAKALLLKQMLSPNSAILLAISSLFLLFFILSISNCFRTIRPSIDGFTPSLFYFGTIQKLSLDVFKQRMKDLDEESIEDELISQTHIVSIVAYRKFTSVRRALNNLIMCLIFWVGVLFLLNFS